MSPKKKPDYDPEEILQSLMDTAVEIYAEEKSLRFVADQLDLNPIKVRKLLITAGEYESDVADKVSRLKREGKSISEIMSVPHLSKASVNSYLPYSKIPYNAKELSANADVTVHENRKKHAPKSIYKQQPVW